MMHTQGRPIRVGAVRPSQLMWSYGIGSLIDLPGLSVMVKGLESWNIEHARPISEERLLTAVRRELGPQVKDLYEPPLPREEPFGVPELDPVHGIGVPVQVFPQWLRCPRCGVIAPTKSGLFHFEGANLRPDKTRYLHNNCSKRGRGRAPVCLPSRFLVACEAGHLDDFPWREFVHRGSTNCRATLEYFEIGSSLETANLFVKCSAGHRSEDSGNDENEFPGDTIHGCGARPRSLAEAFGDHAEHALPLCRGRHPHLNQSEGSCQQQLRTILLGATSSWFPKTISVLSMPRATTELEQMLEERWATCGKIPNPDVIEYLRQANELGSLSRFSNEDIWEAIEVYRTKLEQGSVSEDLKGPEWRVLSDPESAPLSNDFLVTSGSVPKGFENLLLPTMLVEKIREVNALLGFTRLKSPEDLLDGDDDINYARLSLNAPTWIPATEVRGEGLLIRFNPQAVIDWESRSEVKRHLAFLEEANIRWREARRLPTDKGYPGHRHIILHTFAHLVMRELALECGYSGASIRERIYALGEEDEEMAGVLIYTAAPDSEGTLGGLVRLGEAATLGRLIKRALEHARICASDPLCAEHDPVLDRSLHRASCHACTFISETSCEFGNRFLDRATVIPTLTCPDVSFFH